MIACAAETMACGPLPHSRFTVSAGVPTSRPPFTAATRARYMSRISVWMTWPNKAWPTWAGCTPDRLTASRTTFAARSAGGTEARPPPYLPIGVLTADRTNTSSMTFLISHVQAAVDGPDLPGDVRRFVSGQERDHPRDLLRLAQPADRYLAAYPVQHLVRDGGQHVGGDVSGGHAVDRQPGTDPGREL